MFLVSKHTALKMAITRNYVLQKTLSTFANLNFIQKYKKKQKTCHTFGWITFQLEFLAQMILTLNYGIPSSFTTLSP